MEGKKAKIKYIEKPWGFEEILETNPRYTVKRLFMKRGHQCSYQYHKKKKETAIVLSGDLTVVLEDKTLVLKPGDFITLEPLTKHRMKAEGGDCLYMECSTSELDDVVRIEDSYGRK